MGTNSCCAKRLTNWSYLKLKRYVGKFWYGVVSHVIKTVLLHSESISGLCGCVCGWIDVYAVWGLV